jgi:hypothetical protein
MIWAGLKAGPYEDVRSGRAFRPAGNITCVLH